MNVLVCFSTWWTQKTITVSRCIIFFFTFQCYYGSLVIDKHCRLTLVLCRRLTLGISFPASVSLTWTYCLENAQENDTSNLYVFSIARLSNIARRTWVWKSALNGKRFSIRYCIFKNYQLPFVRVLRRQQLSGNTYGKQP